MSAVQKCLPKEFIRSRVKLLTLPPRRKQKGEMSNKFMCKYLHNCIHLCSVRIPSDKSNCILLKYFHKSDCSDGWVWLGHTHRYLKKKKKCAKLRSSFLIIIFISNKCHVTVKQRYSLRYYVLFTTLYFGVGQIKYGALE